MRLRYGRGEGGDILTVKTLESLDDLAKSHCFAVVGGKVGEDTGAEGDLFVEVALGEAVMAELELGGSDTGEISVEDTEGIEVGDMVAANLESTDEELDLKGSSASGKFR